MARRRSRLDPDDIELIAARVVELLRSSPQEDPGERDNGQELTDPTPIDGDSASSSVEAMAREAIAALRRKPRRR
jgi:hypothetical protein